MLYKQLLTPFSSWFILVLCLGVAFFHGLFLYGAASGRDDAYITYWAAQALSHFGTIINYNGEPLEQSSSLLHILLLAILHRLVEIPLPILGVLFSAGMGTLTVLASWRLAVFLEISSAWFIALFSALFPYLVYWSFSGLETTLVAVIVIGLVYSVSQFLTQKISISLFLLTFLAILAYILVRPEAIFITLTFIVGIAVLLSYQQQSFSTVYLGKLFILFGISLTVFVAISLWRYHVFGQLFPQPVYGKTGPIDVAKIILGIRYLIEHYWIPSLVFLMILTVFSCRNVWRYPSHSKRRVAFITMLSLVITTLAFIVVVGGDWMEGGRFLVPIIPLLLLLGLFDLKVSRWERNALLLMLALVATIDTAKFFKERSIGIPFFLAKEVYHPVLQDFNVSEDTFFWFEKANQEHLRDIPFLVTLERIITRLLAVEPEPIVMVSGQMGMVPFYIVQKHFGQVEFMDMKGLTTPHFTHCHVTRHLSTNRFGLHLTHADFFSHFNEIYSQCFPKLPAIIYELGGGKRIEIVENNGYRVVYAQSGVILTKDGWTQRKAWAGQYLAVREDLANKINVTEPHYYQWP